ncbi:structural maintenance of chromosomes flexible hinge domain-containing protein 1 [Mastacembelus armatus]|uniref:structural maintenance of chromosomes flexible hinge domain-containing protein 1 n=1 Tax=Mastacembelus armatus TaxID=205130 RepID=UPI000E45DEB3|nr:structural maintenance of chromosomes flexible hinge domain-containing protein 1 [Mastacembelus armatus]
MFSPIPDRQTPTGSLLGQDSKWIHIYDCRFKDITDRWLDASGLDFNELLQEMPGIFDIQSHETFVLTTTDRIALDYDRFEELQHNSTLYLMRCENQDLPTAMKEHITFTPHYDTLIRSGMYEYYASEGQVSLPYALAELVDNALSATAKNTGMRSIEIRMLFDETLGKPAVVVLDNGCGMTSKQLKNWAVYRLSKFTRKNSSFASQQEGYVRPDPVAHSLNSDISYFGVGGKQAVFYIGDSTRMISKAVLSPDVHELVLSKDDFERKEKNKEDIYSGTILNRKPGDFSHCPDERFLHALIAEESEKESFTAVVITGVNPEHITFLKKDFKLWTRQLAHIYHYYIHGIDGNNMSKASANSNPSKIDIQVTLREKAPKFPRALNLREVDDDMQTLYINASADTFEFKATTQPENGTVEGVLRYHPFLYDKETYPQDPQASLDDKEDDDVESGVHNQARGSRPIFECFWNGRLIPYTKVAEFDWCARPRTQKEQDLPPECYSRISGVLFTDDRFQVSTNKLTFMDLELALRRNDTIFTCEQKASNSMQTNQKAFKRGKIEKEFTQWLKNCHKNLDKQIQFLDYKETITLPDVTPKERQAPWATFGSIKWHGKTYKTGELVKSQRTNPTLYGKVVRFLLYGNYKGDVFATGGQVEVALEPKAFYNKTRRIIPIIKIDRTSTDDAINKHIKSDADKLPHELKVEWPNGNPFSENADYPAGTPLGPLKIEILNKKGESLSRMPRAGQSPVIKLCVKLRLVHHGTGTNQEEMLSYVAEHSAKWNFWFKKIENLTKVGKYTLFLNAMTNDSAIIFEGSKSLNKKLTFTIKGGTAQNFVIGAEISPVHIGMPFNIPLQIKDKYGHSTELPPNIQPEVKCGDLDVQYETVDRTGNSLTIKSVTARGKITDKKCDLKVILPGLTKGTQTQKIFLLPGKPHSLHVKPEDNPITGENGNPFKFDVEIHDEAGNITANARQLVHCEVHGYPEIRADCSQTGVGQFVTKPINLKIIKGEPQKLTVKFSMPNHKNIALVVRELKVTPSTRVSLMEICRQDESASLVLRNSEKIEWLAGGLLENLHYKLFDEAGREIRLTPEIASMIKVTWAEDGNLKDLVQGKLPNIQVPTKVQDARFCKVLYEGQSVSVSFTIVPCPDEPTQLQVTLPQTQTTVKLGETLSKDIILELVDQYGNVSKTLYSTCVNDIAVAAPGLDKSAVTFKWQEHNSCVAVTGVCFQNGTPGSREMRFTFRKYVACVTVMVTAGDPAQLKLVSKPPQPLQVLNGSSIPTPFIVQLFDMWGNPTQDQRVVVECRSSSPKLKLSTAVMSQPVNADGKAFFIVNRVSGSVGYYQLEFKGSFNDKPISGTSLNLNLLPNPNKPVRLSVEYDTKAKLPAGGTFPVFRVTVVSDEGSPITTFDPAAVSMLLWEGVPSGTTQEPDTVFKCSKPMEYESKDCFHFRDKEIPKRAGKHTILFSLSIDKTDDVLSYKIIINVVPNQPVKLGPDSQPPAPVVSYSTAITNRTLVENMTLRIMDSYGNPTGQNLHGKVAVSMKSSSCDGSTNLPLFEGKNSRCQFNLVEGKVHITRLAIMENSPGENGNEYNLIFKPEVSLEAPTPLIPFELKFLFYNDSENQHKMSALSGKKDALNVAIAKYEEIFNDHQTLLMLLTEKVLTSSKKEAELRRTLNQRNINIGPNLSIAEIDRLIKEKSAEAKRIQETSSRVCNIQNNFTGLPDVLGMVGHLACVQDDDAARVISWHLSGDMDCVITTTTAAARTIVDNTLGRQQVMPLDGILMHPGNRPLPHLRNGTPLFPPQGNPIYARDLLIYSHRPEDCNTVFKNILGDTILMDDLYSGTEYRKALIQRKIQCPTILTRQGDRISARGKFGGTQNKAPTISALKVFGAPLPGRYHTLREQIGMLSQYQSVVEKKNEADKDRESHLIMMKSPDNQNKQQDLKEKKKQLEEIERQLASTANRPLKRGPEVVGEPSGFITKRAK